MTPWLIELRLAYLYWDFEATVVLCQSCRCQTRDTDLDNISENDVKEPDCNINHQNWEDNDEDKTFNYLSEFFVSIVTYNCKAKYDWKEFTSLLQKCHFTMSLTLKFKIWLLFRLLLSAFVCFCLLLSAFACFCFCLLLPAFAI